MTAPQGGYRLIQHVAHLHGQHPDACAVVLNPDTLETIVAWVEAAVPMFDDSTQAEMKIFGMAILKSDDLPFGTILVASS